MLIREAESEEVPLKTTQPLDTGAPTAGDAAHPSASLLSFSYVKPAFTLVGPPHAQPAKEGLYLGERLALALDAPRTVCQQGRGCDPHLYPVPGGYASAPGPWPRPPVLRHSPAPTPTPPFPESSQRKRPAGNRASFQ